MHCTSQVMASHGRGMEIPGGVIHCHGKVRQLSRRSHSLSLHCDRTVIALSWTCHALVMHLSWTCHALVMDLCAERAKLVMHFSWNIPLPRETCHFTVMHLSSHCHRHEQNCHRTVMQLSSSVIHCDGTVRTKLRTDIVLSARCAHAVHTLCARSDRTVMDLSCTCHGLVCGQSVRCACAVRALCARCARTDIAMTPP
jgi:hypothetical protein